MSSRVLRWFVAPPEEPHRARLAGSAAAQKAPPVFVPPRAAVTAPAAPAADGPSGDGDVAVLGARGEIDVVAGGAAAMLRRRGGPSVACVWSPGEDHEPVSLPSSPAAARWMRRLQSQGLAATAIGAVARVRLADEPTQALQEVRRMQAVAGGPIVLALTRRDPVLDALLVEAAWLGVLPLADATMTSLVVDQAAVLNPRTVLLDRPASPALRISLRLGLRTLAVGDASSGAAAAHFCDVSV